ncbi:MAG: hypothetical protein OXE52_06715 [Chloroflexi bacterium]|nr:hypothetical protein [Chloroflexota bacterium]
MGEIERAEKSPSLHIIFALAEALDMQAPDLLTLVEE